MIDPSERNSKAESAVLIGLITDRQDATQVTEYLDELEFLATTADITALKRFTQKLHQHRQRQARRGESVDERQRCRLGDLR